MLRCGQASASMHWRSPTYGSPCPRPASASQTRVADVRARLASRTSVRCHFLWKLLSRDPRENLARGHSSCAPLADRRKCVFRGVRNRSFARSRHGWLHGVPEGKRNLRSLRRSRHRITIHASNSIYFAFSQAIRCPALDRPDTASSPVCGPRWFSVLLTGVVFGAHAHFSH